MKALRVAVCLLAVGAVAGAVGSMFIEFARAQAANQVSVTLNPNFGSAATFKAHAIFPASSFIKGSFSTPQFIDMNYGSNGVKVATGSAGGGDFYVTDSGGSTFLHSSHTGITANSVEDPVPVVHHAQTGSPVAIEFGDSAATANALAVSFATAFASAPACTCTDENASAVACSASVAPTTSGVTFKQGGGATDKVDWICIGLK